MEPLQYRNGFDQGFRNRDDPNAEPGHIDNGLMKLAQLHHGRWIVTRTCSCSFRGSGWAGLRTPFSYVASTEIVMDRAADAWVALMKATMRCWLLCSERTDARSHNPCPLIPSPLADPGRRVDQPASQLSQ
jgi:hypothetical protein